MESKKELGVFDRRHRPGFLEKANKLARRQGSSIGMVMCAVLALASTACITWYGDVPEVIPESHVFTPTGMPISFNVKYEGKSDPYITKGSHKRRTDLMRTTLEETLSEHDVFTKATRVYLQSARGLYCLVHITELPFNSSIKEYIVKGDTPDYKGSKLYLLISAGTIFILPLNVDDLGGYAIEYSLYKDNVFQREYRYEFREKGFFWLPTLPFMWVGLLTTGTEEVFEVATQQFLLDAERDGYF